MPKGFPESYCFSFFWADPWTEGVENLSRFCIYGRKFQYGESLVHVASPVRQALIAVSRSDLWCKEWFPGLKSWVFNCCTMAWESALTFLAVAFTAFCFWLSVWINECGLDAEMFGLLTEQSSESRFKKRKTIHVGYKSFLVWNCWKGDSNTRFSWELSLIYCVWLWWESLTP